MCNPACLHSHDIGVCSHYTVTHVRNKNSNIQGRSPNVVSEGIDLKGKNLLPGSKLFPLREVPILKTCAIE